MWWKRQSKAQPQWGQPLVKVSKLTSSGVFFYGVERWTSTHMQPGEDGPTNLIAAAPAAPTTPQFEQFAFKDVELGAVIGEGGSGKVHKAIYKGRTVACKVLFTRANQFGSNGRADEFWREVLTMSRLPPHPNVLRLLGACPTPPTLAVLTEFCSKGSLYSLLHSPQVALTWLDVVRIALGAARGMQHLHQHGVIHRDLKSSNLLCLQTDEGLHCKIADFGLSKSGDINTLTCGLGTFQWMAPEVLSGSAYSAKADVYSFAICLWECASRKLPYHGMNGMQAAMAVMHRGLRPEMPSWCPPSLAALIKHCWQPIADQRPTFDEIVIRLEAISAELRGC